MAIDSEPKNGDFARYIENLTRAGGATPGRVPDKRDAARQPYAGASAPVPPPVTSDSLSTAPWGKPSTPAQRSTPSPRNTPTPGATAPDASSPGSTADAGEVSMAQRARQRKIGVVLTIGGILAGWSAVNIAFRALRSPQFDMDELMPAIFLAFFAFMLLKAAGNARNPRKRPLGKLPPLKTTYRKDGN